VEDDRLLWDVFMSQHQLPALCVAEQIGVFRLLHRGPMAAGDLAVALDVSARGAEALLGLLAGLGLLHRHRGKVHLSEVARVYLLPDSSRYWGAMLRIAWDERCSSLREAVTTGEPPGYGGRDLWATHASVPRQAELFTSAMHAHSVAAAEALAQRVDLSGGLRLLDVGAGSGIFAIALAERFPDLRATLLDLPAICDIARRHVEERGLDGRIELLPCDMFRDPWPAGQDVVLFSDVLHDWDTERCEELLGCAFGALDAGGRVLIHEMLLAEGGDRPLVAAAYSVAMLLTTHGVQRTADEVAALLEGAGMVQPTVIPASGYYSVVMATRPRP
jgi:ubiquinone/menaquinone biosynthesis C-methylase UbiE